MNAGKPSNSSQTLYRLAASHAGYFTAAQAVEVGYSYQAQQHRVDHGNCTRIDRAIFSTPVIAAAKIGM